VGGRAAVISDLALYLVLNMTTCYLMIECAITHPTHFRGDWLAGAVTLLIFSLGAVMLGYYGTQWISTNL